MGGDEGALNPQGKALSTRQLADRSQAISGRTGIRWDRIRAQIAKEESQVARTDALAQADVARTEAQADALERIQAEGQVRKDVAGITAGEAARRFATTEARRAEEARQKKLAADIKAGLADEAKRVERNDFLLGEIAELTETRTRRDSFNNEIAPEGSALRELIDFQLEARQAELDELQAPPAATAPADGAQPVGDLNGDGKETAADQDIAAAQNILTSVREEFPDMKPAEIELKLTPDELRKYRRALEVMKGV